MSGTITDNALNVLGGPADFYDPNQPAAGVTVYIYLDPPQAFYSSGGIGFTPAEVAVDATTGAFSTSLPANATLSPSGSHYRAQIRRWGTPVVTTDPFEVLDGVTARIGALVTPSNLPEDQLSGRSLDYAEISGTFTTTSLTAVSFSSPLVINPTIGARPVELVAYCPVTFNGTGGNNASLSILEGSTLVAIGSIALSANSTVGLPLRVSRRFTPSSGLHTYEAKISVFSTGTGTFASLISTPIYLECIER